MKFHINIMYYFCLYKLHGCWKSCKWVSLKSLRLIFFVYMQIISHDTLPVIVVFSKSRDKCSKMDVKLQNHRV